MKQGIRRLGKQDQGRFIVTLILSTRTRREKRLPVILYRKEIEKMVASKEHEPLIIMMAYATRMRPTRDYQSEMGGHGPRKDHCLPYPPLFQELSKIKTPIDE